MARISPTTTDVLRATGAIAGIALIVAGTYDSRWTPLLGCLAVAALATTEYAHARLRRWIRAGEGRDAERLAALTARQAADPSADPSARPSAGPSVGRSAGPSADRTADHTACRTADRITGRSTGPAADQAVFRLDLDGSATVGPTVAALTADGLLRLLEAVHCELRHATAAAARAEAELADLTREWNALVQELMVCPERCPPR